MSLEKLQDYLPPDTLSYIQLLLSSHKVVIRVTNPRKTRLGSFNAQRGLDKPIICVSKDLNPYAFLITLIHEIAHLKVWAYHIRRRLPHGKEWKKIYTEILFPMIEQDVFPADVKEALIHYLKNPKASTTADVKLDKVLKKYDHHSKSEGLVTIEEIPDGSKFIWRTDRIFQKQHKIRKRYKCIELKTKKVYIFSPIAEVVLVKE
jgi:SprT protein